MRDSINYNLKYFIMRTSSTKPLKNTVRKSPLKMFGAVPNPAMKAVEKVTSAYKASKAKKAAEAAKSTTGAEPRPKAPTKTPPAKMKKSGAGKKC